MKLKHALAQKDPADRSERDVVADLKKFLIAKGWRPLRTQSGKFVNPAGAMFNVGEDGMADFCMIHYLPGLNKPVGGSLILWIEVKKPNYRPSCRCEPQHAKVCRMHRQMKWRCEEEKRGAVVVQVDNVAWFDTW